MSVSTIDGAILGFAASFAGAYVAWLVILERWLEPRLRGWVSVLVGCGVQWTPTLGAFHVWGIDSSDRAGRDAAVAVAGSAIVLGGALVPMIAPLLVGCHPARDARFGVAHYILSLTMAAYVVFRVLRRPHRVP